MHQSRDRQEAVGALYRKACVCHCFKQCMDARTPHPYLKRKAYVCHCFKQCIGAWAPHPFSKVGSIGVPPVRKRSSQPHAGDCPILSQKTRCVCHCFKQCIGAECHTWVPHQSPRRGRNKSAQGRAKRRPGLSTHNTNPALKGRYNRRFATTN